MVEQGKLARKNEEPLLDFPHGAAMLRRRDARGKILSTIQKPRKFRGTLSDFGFVAPAKAPTVAVQTCDGNALAAHAVAAVVTEPGQSSVVALRQPAPQDGSAQAVSTSTSLQTSRFQRHQATPSDADLEGPGFIRLPAVLRLLNIGRSSWYAGIQRGHFPSPVKLSLSPQARATGYLRSDIKALIHKLSKGAVP